MPFNIPMFPCPSLLTGCRRAALLCVSGVVLLAPASAAQAQRLLTLVPGVAEAASAGDLGPSIGPAPTAVQVDLDLLRGAPARLEVPTPDGSVLSAERSVFEDRGGGDLMWSGGQRDAGYDTVVLTVEGGRLVGRFGAAGGGVYQIHAERDGRGGMAPLVGPGLEEWCGVEAGAEDFHDGAAHVAARARPADLPERVSNPQSHDRLDILVAYTATAAANWADRGGALAAIRHAVDYLKMVFRNNDLPVEPHIVHIAQASAALDRAGREWGWHGSAPGGIDPLLEQLQYRDGELLRLRHEHRADLVHLFTGEHPTLAAPGRRTTCGVHRLLRKGNTAFSFSGNAYGRTVVYPAICGDYAGNFAHEIGHGLGAHHDPANVGRPEDLFRSYALGHPNFDVMPSIGTVMSYPGQREPFFSTTRIRPWGAVVGIEHVRDNERLLRETVQIGVRYSDYLRSLEGIPAQPTDLRVRFDGVAARLSWRDNAPDADGYEVEHVWWYSPGRPDWRLQAVEGRSGATLPLESTEPGTSHAFLVRATKGKVRSLRSSEVRFVVPGEPIEAPSGVGVTVGPGFTSAKVRWTDNSDNESGFDVQLLQDGEPIARWPAEADSERADFAPFWIRRQYGAEYGARVFAYNSSGYSESSEVATFRWADPRNPRPIAGLSAAAIGPTTVRVTWRAEPGAGYSVYAILPHWESRRRWHGSRDGRGRAYFDFENLARGGRYRFLVFPSELGGLVRGAEARLTLGARGDGPPAPSDVSWVLEGVEGNRARLSWKDNSSDELGFEVQVTTPASRDRAGSFDWRRVVTVPADTESAAHDLAISEFAYHFRVFAFNERGFSLSSSLLSRDPRIVGLTATVGDTEVELRWDVWSAELATGMQVRWKASADLPFDDAVDAWTDLPAAAREYTVTGLRNDTVYTFAVRVLSASGAGSVATARATPRGRPEASFRLGIPCEEDLCRTFTDAPVSFVDTSGGNVTEWRWSFGDGAASNLRSPTHAWSTPGFYDVTLTVSDGSSSDSAARILLVEAAAPAGSCRFDEETICLRDSRFEVKANWWSADGDSGPGWVVYAGTNDSGLFRFFDPLNWEILIKVLDGCGINGRMWVLGAATTDLGYRILVTDTVTGESRSYVNEPGQPAPAIVDTEAFSGPCDGGAGP